MNVDFSYTIQNNALQINQLTKDQIDQLIEARNFQGALHLLSTLTEQKDLEFVTSRTAMILLLAGETKRAIETISGLDTLTTLSETFLVEKATILLAAQQYLKAKEALQQAKSISQSQDKYDSKISTINALLIKQLMLKVFQGMQEDPDVVNFKAKIEGLLERTLENPYYLVRAIGDLVFSKGKFQDAFETYDLALDLDSKTFDSDLQVRRAIAAFKIGQTRIAQNVNGMFHNLKIGHADLPTLKDLVRTLPELSMDEAFREFTMI